MDGIHSTVWHLNWIGSANLFTALPFTASWNTMLYFYIICCSCSYNECVPSMLLHTLILCACSFLIFTLRQKIIHNTTLSYVNTYLRIIRRFVENLPSPPLPSSLLISSLCSSLHHIRSSCPVGWGWFDIMYVTKHPEHPDLILELAPFCNICKIIILKTKTTASKKSSTSYIEDVDSQWQFKVCRTLPTMMMLWILKMHISTIPHFSKQYQHTVHRVSRNR